MSQGRKRPCLRGPANSGQNGDPARRANERALCYILPWSLTNELKLIFVPLALRGYSRRLGSNYE